MISNEESFDGHFGHIDFGLFIDIYSEYYSVRLLSKMSGHHCAYFTFLSKHMARVDCFAPMHAWVIGDSTARLYCLKGRLSRLTDASRQYRAMLIV